MVQVIDDERDVFAHIDADIVRSDRPRPDHQPGIPDTGAAPETVLYQLRPQQVYRLHH